MSKNIPIYDKSYNLDCGPKKVRPSTGCVAAVGLPDGESSGSDGAMPVHRGIVSQGISRKELDEWGDRFKLDLGALMTAKLAALPCSAHDQRLAGIAAKADDARERANRAETKAEVLEQKAQVAFDMASGNIWKIFIWGLASISLAMATDFNKMAAWFKNLVHNP
jgi:hypothetical protein